jgi:hypothetical protein
MSNALEVQVGINPDGTKCMHYKDLKIQPIEFIQKNKIGFIEGNIIKYICRYKNKNGKQDLEKIKHYIDLLIQLEYDE